MLPFVTTYHPAVKVLKQILIEHWNLIQNQLFLKTIFKNLSSSPTKRKDPSNTHLLEQKYDLKAIMRHDLKSHMGIRAGLFL